MTDEPTIDISEKVAYLRFERSVSPEQYGKRTASLSVPIALGDDQEANARLIDDISDLVRAVVLAAVEVPFEFKDGALVESAPAVAAKVEQPAARPAPAAAAAPAGDTPACPKCGGGMFDNREGKRNPKAPDFKCKKYKGDDKCDGAIWP